MRGWPIPQTVLTLLALTMVFPAFLGTAQATGASQIVFSCTSSQTPSCVATGDWVSPPKDTHFGFWYWCQASSTNAYGPDCSGSIYIYGEQLAAVGASCTSTKSVTCVTSNGGGSYTLIANGKNGWKCKLTNTPPVTRGATNKVTMTCTNPAGSGTATGAVVQVT